MPQLSRLQKMTHLLKNAGLAGLLCNAGYDTPRKIKAASDQALLAIPRIGQSTLNTIRERFGSV